MQKEPQRMLKRSPMEHGWESCPLFQALSKAPRESYRVEGKPWSELVAVSSGEPQLAISEFEHDCEMKSESQFKWEMRIDQSRYRLHRLLQFAHLCPLDEIGVGKAMRAVSHK